MSRLTAAQVIALGEYLEPDFDPSTLTVPQLLGVFGFHNVNYPSQYTKPKLVQLFNEEIKPRSKKFKRERIKRENSQASDDGITDGLTGKPITKKVVAPRRSSRRTSRAPTEEELEQPEPTAPKRRRSSAGPSLGGPSRRKSTKPAQPALPEESEPEEESEPAVHKVGRKKHSGDAGTQARGIPKSPLLLEDNDSGWEDNNVFQSGAESSSPMRPSPAKPRTRRSSARPTIKSRKSMSEPPQKVSETKTVPLKSSRAPSVKPPESKFEPALPSEVSRRTRALVAKKEEAPPVFEAVVEEKATDMQSTIEEELLPEEQPITDEEAPVTVVQESAVEIEETDGDIAAEQVKAVSQRIAEGGRSLAVRELPEDASRDNKFLRMLLYLLLLSSAAFMVNYKKDSAEIGFCERGTNTNAVLEERRARWDAILSCNRENRTTLFLPPTPDSAEPASPMPTASVSTENEEVVHRTQSTDMESCPLPPLLPLPRPDTCTPCPRHAECAPQTVTCDHGYIIKPHPLLSFLPVPGTSSSLESSSKGPAPANTYTRPGHILSPDADVSTIVYSALSVVLDGLPGLGPVAIPPRCAEDPRRKLHIGVLGKAVGSMLAAERGRRLCEGIGLDDSEGDAITEAKKWGVELGKLKEDVRKKTPPHLQSTLEDTFNEAVQQLVHWGGVFMAEDEDGRRYIAHRTPSMGWDCVVKVKTREAWTEWRRSIIGTLTLIFSALFLKRRRAQNQVETERVSSLVQIALDLLRNQELAHHTDPVTAPHPYLSSLQLRDLVLQGEHSISTRRKLWDRVERIVESNVNVRTNLEEVEGGDEVRVWRWVGGAGTISSPAKKTPPFAVEG